MGVIVRSTVPVPLSATCCGLVAVLSLIESVALCEPAAFGVNATPSVQDVLGATVTGIAPHVPAPVTAYSVGSDEVTLPMNSGFVPMFATVMVLLTVSPTGELPNANEAVTDTEVGSAGSESSYSSTRLLVCVGDVEVASGGVHRGSTRTA